MGADDLLAHGDMVAVMEDHNLGQGNDPFANSFGIGRSSYYNYTGNPTAIFDGLVKVVGGNHTSSMYTTYLPKYNQRIAVPSNVQLSMTLTNTGLNYHVVLHATKVGNLTTDPKVIHFAVTQSHITYSWEQQSHLEYVIRLMVPDINGTPIDFSSGDEQTVELDYALDATWPVADVEFITWIQDLTTKEILNGMKKAAVDLSADFSANNTTISKGGSVTFTSAVTGGYMNARQTYSWTLPGGTPDTSSLANVTSTYPECGSYNAMLIVNRGGQIDTLNKVKYINVGTVVNVLAIPNDTVCNYTTVTLDATTPGATYLWAPGGATTPTLTVDPAVWGLGNHIFSVTVSTPDGCSPTLYPNVFFDDCTGFGTKTSDLSTKLYPNPNTGSFILELNSLKAENVNISITNSLGMNVYSETGITFSGKYAKKINMNDAPAGVYFLTIKSSDKSSVQKFLVK
jgi:hypothetical protein